MYYTVSTLLRLARSRGIRQELPALSHCGTMYTFITAYNAGYQIMFKWLHTITRIIITVYVFRLDEENDGLLRNVAVVTNNNFTMRLAAAVA